MDKKIIFIFAVLFLIPLIASALPSQTNVNTQVGYDIGSALVDTVKVQEDFKFHVHVFNRSDGRPIVNNGTVDCILHMYNSTGSHIFEGEMGDDSNGFDYDITLIGGNFSYVGHYYAIVYCNSTAYGGFATYDLEATSTGQNLTNSKSILYIGLLAILIFMFIVDLGAITLLPTGNYKDANEEIININHLKHLRPVLWTIAYALLMAILFISSNVALSYLGTQLIGDVLFVMFRIMGIILPIMIIVMFLWLFVSIFKDREIKRLLEQGVPVGEKAP